MEEPSGRLLSRLNTEASPMGLNDAATSRSDHENQPSRLSNKLADVSQASFIDQYVDINLVRKTIAQYMIEIFIVCVILTYLVYYFTQVSQRPKLIGDHRSKFVRLIRDSFKDTLSRRFSPLIYFWGTNPQTCLFGYLQGNTSNDEMPRNKFKRQYLYVSDAQYLASNVDLSDYYKDRLDPSRSHQLVQLEANDLMNSQTTSLLDQNIRFVLDSILSAKRSSQMINGERNTIEERPKSLHNEKRFHESPGSSSGDSGVYAGHSSASSSSSTSSLSIDMDTTQKCCSCINFDDTEPKLEAFHDDRTFCNSEQDSDSRLLREREKLEFGQCALDWHQDSHRNYHRNKLVALISAGMTTGSDKKYVTDTVTTLERLGYEVCVFIRRGVGGLKLSSARFFSPSKWRDFEAAIRSIRKQRPGARLVAIGFSFGSIELCRYMSMSRERSLVDSALLISCPFDPEAGGRNMRKRCLNRRIDAYLAKNLGKQLHQALLSSDPQTLQTLGIEQSSITNESGSIINLAALPKIKSLVDFEDNYNRRVQNYPNSAAYALDSRLHEHLIHIKTPTLCLSSEDDFMAPVKLLPIEQIKANENLCMILTKRGGHMAFIDGLVWPKKPYFAQRIIEKYMEALKRPTRRPSAKNATNVVTTDSRTSATKTLTTNLPTKDQQIQKSHHVLQMFV